MDLNGDGKHDWKDDMIIYHLAQTDDKPKQEPSYQNPYGNKTISILTWLAAAYAGAVISGILPVNFFTGITALLSAGWVAFFLWCEIISH